MGKKPVRFKQILQKSALLKIQVRYYQPNQSNPAGFLMIRTELSQFPDWDYVGSLLEWTSANQLAMGIPKWVPQKH